MDINKDPRYIKALKAQEKIIDIMRDLDDSQSYMTITLYLATGLIKMFMAKDSLSFDEAAKVLSAILISHNKGCKEQGVDNDVVKPKLHS